MTHEPRLPSTIKQELTGTRWRWRSGGKHWHLIVNGQMVGIWPRAAGAGASTHYQVRNIRAQIRRALKNGTDSR